eukprot:scpid25132/ scgid5756/ Protein TILB homolog; Leucine-rich repeat-containing protein 6; Leucine-rich testis-specific protein; Testis-specific leucine-rich repeat protein
MRLTAQVLHSRADGERPEDVEYLNLTELSIVAIELLQHFPKLAYLNLCDNKLETVENLESCRELWHLDLCHNKMLALDGLRHFPVFGTLFLASNRLDWQSLKAIQHIHIVDLQLQGNPRLQDDVHYRIHAIDCLPQIWMLDGIMVTACERQRVARFFKDRLSRADLKPVRRKLPPIKFVPSSMKKLTVNGIYGSRTKLLMSHVPLSSPSTTELDWCRLRYIMKMFSSEVKMFGEHTSAVSYASVSSASLAETLLPNLDDLLNERHKHLEQSNMLLLLLVVSLEFSLPARVIENALETARLQELGKVQCMQLFLLEKKLRCRLCGILLSAAILDKESGEKEALYPQLYSALRSIVTSLMYKAYCGLNGALAEQHRQHSLPASEHDVEKHRQLLAAEVVQLFCLVPAFFDLLSTDTGILDLAMVATGDGDLFENISALQEELAWEKVDRWQIYQRMAAYILLKVKATMDASTARVPIYGRQQQLSQTRKAVFSKSKRQSAIPASRRPKSSPIGKTQMSYTSKNAANPMISASTVLAWNRTQPTPRVGDMVLVQLSPKVFGQILSFTNLNSAVIQVEKAFPVYGTQGTEQLLIDLEPLVFDQQGYWKPITADTIGARQKTWQSADALMEHGGPGFSADAMGRFSPAPPPSSPHHSRTSSVANVMNDQSSDSDTGTESGDEDERSPSSKPSSGRDHAPAQDQTTTLGTKSPRDSSAAGRRKSGDEMALQAHVEMVIQHLQDTGLSKQAVVAKPLAEKTMTSCAEEPETESGDASSHAIAIAKHGFAMRGPSPHRTVQPKFHSGRQGGPASRSQQGMPSPVSSSTGYLPVLSGGEASSSHHSLAAAHLAQPRHGQGSSGLHNPAASTSTATVMHSLNSTIPGPSQSGEHATATAALNRGLRSAPPQQRKHDEPQLAARTVTMAFQSRRQTGRATSWNTVYQPVDRTTRHQHTSSSRPVRSALVNTLPVTIALEMSQAPMATSMARSSMHHPQAYRTVASSQRKYNHAHVLLATCGVI